MPTPIAPIQAAGSRTIAARNTIDQPRAQSVAAPVPFQRFICQTNLKTKTSSAARKSPRDTRKRARSPFVFPRESDRKAAVPAKKVNPGAQKCVTNRVKKYAGVVLARSTGSKGAFEK